MDSVLKDSRFAKIATDKKFRPLEKKKRKVNIDNRFQSVLKDERFISNCNIDPRGRPKSYSSKENYEKFYELKGSSSESDATDSDSESDDNEKTVNNKHKVITKDLDAETDNSYNSEQDEVDSRDDSQKKSDDEFEESETEAKEKYMDKRIQEKLQDMSVDYARGNANLYSDSSSDDSSTDEEDGDMAWEAINKIGSLDADVERTEEVTKRLAVCNMDWDKINAKDIFVALSSFCSGGGCVKSIYVYISEFGKSRIEEEERIGPIELNRLAQQNRKIEEDYEDILKSGKKAELETIQAMETVREYQLNRLKYYYAVAEFDSPDTANSVYTEIDGKELESSAVVFDLRFIPDDMTFDEQPASSCTSLPDASNYKPKFFFCSALNHEKVKLTWDEEDQTRREKIKEVNSRKLEDDEDFSYLNELIASPSEAEDDNLEESLQKPSKKKKKLKIKKRKGKEDNKSSDSDANDESGSGDESDDQINKYRALLLGIDNKVVKEDEEESGGMEFTWNDDEEKPTKQIETDKLTPWEKYLKNKKEKRMKYKEKKKNNKGSDDSEDNYDEDFMLDEQDSKKNKRKMEDSDEEVENNDLALLVMDEQDNNQHFNFKSIVEEETQSKSKKKRQNKKKKSLLADDNTQEDFDINVHDDRFAAIYSRPEFNIDPSEQNFKKTKGMENLIGEKQKRVASGQIKNNKKEDKKENKSKLDPEITASLKFVKNKWANNSKKKSKF